MISVISVESVKSPNEGEFMGQYMDIVKAFKEQKAKQQGHLTPSSTPERESLAEANRNAPPAPETEHMFLSQHLPQSALDAFPDWSALLVKSAVLGMTVWIVRDKYEGESLAKETGYPALVLDDVLRQVSRARESLFPCLILGGTVH